MHQPRPRRGRGAATLAALSLALSVATAASAAAMGSSPEDPIDVPALPYVTSIDASTASSDPTYTDCGSMDHALWFRFEPTTTQDVQVDTAGSTYDTVLDVRVQDGGDLLCLDDTASSQQARVAFTARSGMAYLIGVGRSVLSEQPGEGPAGLVPATADDLQLELRIEQTRIQRRGAPSRSTHWARGGQAVATEVLIDEPDEYRWQGFALYEGRSNERSHEDIDLTWRHYRIDHDKQVVLMEDWDAYGPGLVTVDRKLEHATASGQLWLQGLLCVYPLHDTEVELAALAGMGTLDDEEPSEGGPCSVIGGSVAEVDASVIGIGDTVTTRVADMQHEHDRRELLVERRTSRDGSADLRVTSELLSFGFEQAPAQLVYGQFRATNWHR